MKETLKWLQERPDWQKKAVLDLLNNTIIDDNYITKLTEYSKTNEGQSNAIARDFSQLQTQEFASTHVTKLLSIGNIEGIEKLNPRSPLQFKGDRISIVYGKNGSGKSGYVRLFKSICGKPHADALRSDIYTNLRIPQKCKVEYEYNGKRQTDTYQISDGYVQNLSDVEIYDSKLGAIYVESEKEATYSPLVLKTFSEYANVVTRVKVMLTEQSNKLNYDLPLTPSEYRNTRAGRLYGSLKAEIDEQAINYLTIWSQEDEDCFNKLAPIMNIEILAKNIRELQQKKEQIVALKKSLLTALHALSQEKVDLMSQLKQDSKSKRWAAIQGGIAIESSSFKGIGESIWISMWSAAKEYSNTFAYPDKEFPVIDDGSRCVLCHQIIGEDAKNRFKSFDTYIKGSLETEAIKSENLLKESIESLPVVKESSTFQTTLSAAGINDHIWLSRLEEFWRDVEAVKKKVIDPSIDNSGYLSSEKYTWIPELDSIMNELQIELDKLIELQKEEDFSKLEAQKTELNAKKWTYQQTEAIKKKIESLKAINDMYPLIANADTTAISRKASDLAEQLLTQEYVERFNTELSNLGSTNIKAKLVKKRAEKGKPLFTIILDGVSDNKIKVRDILSEGEHRIVELAAFLADMTGKKSKAPFIFDDPISSLDDDYQDRVVKRLKELSNDRQVIVFTHRLSMVEALLMKPNDYGNCITITNENWGTGEPNELPFSKQKPKKCLIDLRTESMELQKVSKNLKRDDIDKHLNEICRKIRITSEKIIEQELLSGIVKRYSREIHSKNLIHNLHIITPNDCSLLDRIITDYSFCMHDLPVESTDKAPSLEKVIADIDTLIEWLEEFSKRKPSH